MKSTIRHKCLNPGRIRALAGSAKRHVHAEEFGIGARRPGDCGNVCPVWRLRCKPDHDPVLFQSAPPSTDNASADDKRSDERIAARDPLPAEWTERGTSILVRDQVLVVQR